MPGQEIIIAQRYRLDNEVAAGATGRVWRATDMLLHRQVAVKVLRRDYARDPALLSQFLLAGSQATAVSHPNVARVYDHGEGGPGGAPYLVMELIEGPALAEVIRGEEVRASFIATALAQAAEGLHAAHQAGLLHGDLKPANILLWPQAGRRAVVTDFGITHALAAIPRAGHTPGTLHGTGTVLYLAPERVSGGLGTRASDLYSLGVIACEWLTGSPPFTGTSQQVLAAHLRGPLPRLPAAVPPGLAELVTRLAAKSPGDRFFEASEVAAAARALAAALRQDPRDRVARFPARREHDRDLVVIREEARTPAAIRAGATATATRPGDEQARPRLSGLAAHKREIAWAASALVLAGLMGWAPSASVPSTVKVVPLAIPAAGQQAPAGAHLAPGRERTGGGSGSHPAATRRHAAGGGHEAGGHVPGSGPARPSPAASGRPSGSGSRGPCPCGPPVPPTVPPPTVRPAPGAGPRPPSARASQPPAQPLPLPPPARASQPPARPLPLPPAPLSVPTISVSLPPLTIP